MGLIIQTVGLVASALAIGLFFVPDLRRKAVEVLGPYRSMDWQTVIRRAREATDQVDILQTWIPGLRFEIPHIRKNLEAHPTRFRFLLCDQTLVPFRLRARRPTSGRLTQNVEDLTEVAEDFNQKTVRVEGRFYSALPFGPIYRIDDRVYWGLYIAHDDSMTGPVFVTKRTSPLGRIIMTSFETMWQSGSVQSGDLRLPGPTEGRRLARRPQSDIDVKAVTRELSGALRKVERASDAATGGCLVLVRHAETDLNAGNMFTGSLNVPINAAGRRAARELGALLDRFKWSRVLCSPLRRALETAAEISGGQWGDIEYRGELRERGMGDVEGLSKESYHDSLSKYRGIDVEQGFFVSADGGESYADVLTRVYPLLLDLIADVVAGRSVLVCSHEGPIRVIEMALLGLTPEEAIQHPIDNCHLATYVAP